MNSPLTSASWLGELSDEHIQQHVGGPTWARGRAYAEAGMVRSLTTADQGRMLLAEVEGNAARPYQTLITLTNPRGSAPPKWTSRCSCPMQVDCKHTVAVLLRARADFRAMVGARSGIADWERTLAPLIADAPEPVDNAPGLGLVIDPLPVAANYRTLMGPPRIAVRPTRRTKNGWARNFTWSEMATPRVPLHKRQLAAMRAIHDLHRITGGRDGYFYTATDVYLGALGSRVWPLLRQAVDAGVELLPGPNLHGEVRLSDDPVQVVLDVTYENQDILLVCGLDADTDLGPVHGMSVLGDPPHGFAVNTGGGLLLVPLDKELDPRLTELLTNERQLRVPAADADRFVNLYLPRLRDVARVTSRDGSVSIPEQPRPVLRIRLTQPAPTLIEAHLDFAYAAPSGALLTQESGPLPRSRAAEQSLLASLDVLDGLPGARTRQGTGYAPFWSLAARVVLSGMSAVRFVDEVLPDLELEADIHITFDDELITYEQALDTPLVDVGLTDSREGHTDWFDLAITISVGGEEVPFEPLFRALAAGDDAMILDSGVWFRLDDPALDSLRQLIAEARELAEPGGPMRLSRYHLSLWDELADLGVATIDSAAWTRSVEHLRRLADAAPPPDPEGLHATLRPYQREGFHWLSSLWSADLGGILADDMGLGKTVQTLALLEQARAAGELTDPVLVVAPTSMLGVWASEAARFAPELRVVVLGETGRRRGIPLDEVVAGAHLVVTSFAVARIDGDDFELVDWRGLIVDEAQFVKNHNAKTHHVLRRIRAPFRLAMTGTPLENSLMDLWSLLALVAPGLYPRADKFTEFYRRPIESGESPETLERLRRRIKPLMLRRTKAMVATDLPEKQEQSLAVELSAPHRRLYDQHLQRERQRVLGLLDDPVANRVAILASLTRLRQLALDPRLVDPDRPGNQVPAKVETLIEHLGELRAEGHRALVFSQFTSFLKIVQDHLTEAGITTEYLDGATRNRASVISAFKEGDATAFLISLKAGGVGLTLTEADYVYVLDPWWNPAAEAQAIDRAHRIGQDKMVMVYRLISADTIEEKVVALQQRKRDLFQRVVDEGGSMSGQITADDIRALLEPD
ncbi:MAG: DEAD/DEAH box helicase [Tetrasphaera sp.]